MAFSKKKKKSYWCSLFSKLQSQWPCQIASLTLTVKFPGPWYPFGPNAYASGWRCGLNRHSILPRRPCTAFNERCVFISVASNQASRTVRIFPHHQAQHFYGGTEVNSAFRTTEGREALVSTFCASPSYSSFATRLTYVQFRGIFFFCWRFFLLLNSTRSVNCEGALFISWNVLRLPALIFISAFGFPFFFLTRCFRNDKETQRSAISQ